MSHPETDYINATFTVRDMRVPSDVKLTRTSMVRWIALSLGLLSADESRTTIVPVLDSLFEFQLQDAKDPSVRDLAERAAVPEKAVRYHLGRLLELGIVDVKSRRYSFKRDTYSDDLQISKAFKQHYSTRVGSALNNVESVLEDLQREYFKP